MMIPLSMEVASHSLSLSLENYCEEEYDEEEAITYTYLPFAIIVVFYLGNFML